MSNEKDLKLSQIIYKNSRTEEAHALPLMPLKERDFKALATLFDQLDSTEIEADINKTLSLMVPEPSWDEDPYEFLQEYL
ncbi:MAG: hypothetical protein QNJ49_12255 [Mastigocoleus sp. MO_167.B18]|nr:hypothetical protein [Mastigocoleus sp. MO_167.B18]